MIGRAVLVGLVGAAAPVAVGLGAVAEGALQARAVLRRWWA